VNDDRENDLVSARAGAEGSDLLELVRAAEEEAKLGADGKSAANVDADAPVSGLPKEEFVDVGDDAIDAPPSLPPVRAATPGRPFTPARAFAPGKLSTEKPFTPEKPFAPGKPFTPGTSFTPGRSLTPATPGTSPTPAPVEKKASTSSSPPAPSGVTRVTPPASKVQPPSPNFAPLAGIVLVFALAIAAIALLAR
jgi:hypothetical protein